MNPENPHTWPRLYLDRSLSAGIETEISAESTHYLINVLRLETGSPIRLFNGKDGEWLARLTALPKNKKSGALLKIETLRHAQRPCPDLWLCAAPIKKNHFDFMIQKATELGVSVIQPVLTARTQIREVNISRLREIAIEAAEQSERLDIPVIKEPVPLPKLVESWAMDRTPVVCAEFGQAHPPVQALAHKATSAGLWIGPEGGYTQDEINALLAMKNVCALRLGPRILRADTAAIAALACWQALCGDWGEQTDTKRE